MVLFSAVDKPSDNRELSAECLGLYNLGGTSKSSLKFEGRFREFCGNNILGVNEREPGEDS